MTHQPEIEELLGHLLNPPHHCSQATRLREEIAQTVVEARRQVTLVPAQGTIQIDLTDEVGDALAARREEFERLHDAHHAEEIATTLVDRLIREQEGEDGGSIEG